MLRGSGDCTTVPLTGHPIRLSRVIGCSDDVLGGDRLCEFSRDGSATKRHVRFGRQAIKFYGARCLSAGGTIWGLILFLAGRRLPLLHSCATDCGSLRASMSRMSARCLLPSFSIILRSAAVSGKSSLMADRSFCNSPQHRRSSSRSVRR